MVPAPVKKAKIYESVLFPPIHFVFSLLFDQLSAVSALLSTACQSNMIRGAPCRDKINQLRKAYASPIPSYPLDIILNNLL